MSTAWGASEAVEDNVKGWSVWADSGGGAVKVIGDADWGAVKVEQPLPILSSVEDIGSVAWRKFTVTKDKYATGSGSYKIYIRGAMVSFTQLDAIVPWEEYTVPINRKWRYVQTMLEYVAPSAGLYYPVGADCVLYLPLGDGSDGYGLSDGTDISSYGNNATWTGASPVALGASLDGIDDKVTWPTVTTNALAKNNSIYIWIYYEVLDAAQIPVGGTAGNYEFVSDGNTTYTSRGGIYRTVAGSGLSIKTWYYLAVLTDADALPSLYVNGSLIGAFNAAHGAPISVSTLGSYVDNTFRFHGICGELLIFDSLRTDRVDYFNFTKARYGVA